MLHKTANCMALLPRFFAYKNTNFHFSPTSQSRKISPKKFVRSNIPNMSPSIQNRIRPKSREKTLKVPFDAQTYFFASRLFGYQKNVPKPKILLTDFFNKKNSCGFFLAFNLSFARNDEKGKH